MAVKNDFNAFENDKGAKAAKKLMDNQDTKHKGDFGGDERKLITFYVSAEKHAALKAHCRREGCTMTRLLQNAVDEILEKDEQ